MAAMAPQAGQEEMQRDLLEYAQQCAGVLGLPAHPSVPLYTFWAGISPYLGLDWDSPGTAFS